MSRTEHWTSRRKDRLTRAQEARLPQICEKWRKIALSTEPSDRKKAQAAVSAGYRRCGWQPPKKFVWLESPFQLSEDLHSQLCKEQKFQPVFRSRYSGPDYEIYLGSVRFYK